MLKENGYIELKEYHNRTFKKEVVKVNDEVYYFKGFGHSNSTLFIGDDGCVLVDTLDTDKRGERLLAEIRTITDKPVKTIIFTHSHPDHTGGSGAFRGNAPEVIAHAPLTPVLDKSQVLNDILGKRAARQFGYQLTEEELITQGMGPREGRASDDGKYDILPVTRYINEKECEVTFHGVTLRLIFAPGETDDQMYVYSEKYNLLCCGDNFYPCFPNLYALRGSRYRDVANWVNSLSKILEIDPEILLPGHGYSITEKDVANTISLYRDAIEYVLGKTLEEMAKGKTCEEVSHSVKLPDNLASLPFLEEHYGCVEWSVKSIYAGYVGWFDGNPTNIHTLSPVEEARNMVSLAGGKENMLKNISDSMNREEYLWAMKLCDTLLRLDKNDITVQRIKAECCLRLAELETSANGRHYYQVCAKELEI